MEKLILIANINILPGFEDEVKKAAIALAAETRQETGSESFLIHTRNDSPQTIVFYEIYHSQEAFQQHKTFAYSEKFFEFVNGKIKDDKIEVIFLTRLDS
ncbi:putative quinol monooxygenase [Mucilaginibacter sp. McL0603]|uniref:putative quinol monooxygenase n=1 Tax=Mucilaginibacter sp. McL0603 TaxID=3415670 RepID=UPI003CEB78D1